MKIAIVYESLTGNTKVLAQAIGEALAEQKIVCMGGPGKEVEADLYLVGSWTDKGMCAEGISTYLKGLKEKRIGYFGTAGFGGSEDYYQMLFQRIKGLIHPSNRLLGKFYCQGKMPSSVRQRYEKALEQHPGDEQILQSLENFDRALSHPDQDDLERAKQWAKQLVLQVENG